MRIIIAAESQVALIIKNHKKKRKISVEKSKMDAKLCDKT